MSAGHDTVVWNRTASRAKALVEEGARYLPAAADAIAESPVVLVCVDDYAASDSFLRTPAAEAALNGGILVQLSTGSPKHARGAHDWARSVGSDYLDGAILNFPSDIGAADTIILVAGDASAFEKAKPILRVLAPATSYLGQEPGLAAILDEALLSGYLGAIVGVANGAALCEAGGLPLTHYCDLLDRVMPTFVQIVKQTTQKIADDDLVDTEATLQTWAATLDYMSESASDAGFSNEIPAFIRSLCDRAVERGLGEHDVAALIEVLRPGKN